MRLARVSKPNLVFALAVAALIVFASVATDTFLTERNLTSVSRQIVTNGFLSLGMLLVILTGGIDLSVGAVVALSGMIAASLLQTGWSPAAVIPLILVLTSVLSVMQMPEAGRQIAYGLVIIVMLLAYGRRDRVQS